MSNGQDISHYTHAIRACVELARKHRNGRLNVREAEFAKALSKSLGMFWELATRLICESLPKELNASVEANHRGYIAISQGSAKALIPFYFADVFPRADYLTQILSLARKVQISDTAICAISGSGCYLGSGLPVGDLDFCEYAPSVGREYIDDLLAVIQRHDADTVCFKLFIDDQNNWIRPWPPILMRADNELVARLESAMKSSEFRQVSFIVKVPNIGALEATNLLVNFDAAYSDTGEARNSFTGQEVPVVGESGPPRDLCAPLEIGRYIVWLADEIQSTLSNHDLHPRYTIKAARRTISALRILQVKSEADEVSKILEDPSGARLSALYSRCNLYKAISPLSDSSMDGLKKELEMTVDMLRESGSSKGASYDELTENELNELYQLRNWATPKLARALRVINDHIGT